MDREVGAWLQERGMGALRENCMDDRRQMDEDSETGNERKST